MKYTLATLVGVGERGSNLHLLIIFGYHVPSAVLAAGNIPCAKQVPALTRLLLQSGDVRERSHVF